MVSLTELPKFWTFGCYKCKWYLVEDKIRLLYLTGFFGFGGQILVDANEIRSIPFLKNLLMVKDVPPLR